MNKIIGTIAAIILLLILVAATPAWHKPKTIVVKFANTRDTAAVIRNVKSLIERNDSLILIDTKDKKKIFYPNDSYFWVYKFD
jgi:hypothetical protein